MKKEVRGGSKGKKVFVLVRGCNFSRKGEI